MLVAAPACAAEYTAADPESDDPEIADAASDGAPSDAAVLGDGSGDATRDAATGDATIGDATIGDGGVCPTDVNARPNEGLAEQVYTARCPAGMIVAGAVCIDRYEAYVDLVDAQRQTIASWSPYYPPPKNKAIAARSAPNAVPQGYISGADALRACEGAGKRLCASDEWLRACRGSAQYTYPYGNTKRPGVCNDSYPGHPAVTCLQSSDPSVFSRLDEPGINQQAGTVDRAGTNPGCVTEEGAYDMMGNLHEWILDGPPPPATAAVDFRGGFYADTTRNGEGCLYKTSAHNFAHYDYSTGFRCCAPLR